MQAKMLRQYGGETLAVALEACAEQLEIVLLERDETTLTLTDAARESGYSTEHLGRLVRDGKIPNAGRSGAPRIARNDLPRKTSGRKSCLAAKRPRRDVSTEQVVQSVIERGT